MPSHRPVILGPPVRQLAASRRYCFDEYFCRIILEATSNAESRQNSATRQSLIAAATRRSCNCSSVTISLISRVGVLPPEEASDGLVFALFLAMCGYSVGALSDVTADSTTSGPIGQYGLRGPVGFHGLHVRIRPLPGGWPAPKRCPWSAARCEQKKGYDAARTGVRHYRAGTGAAVGRRGALHRQRHRGDGQIHGVGGAVRSAGSRSPSKMDREVTGPGPVDAITIPLVPLRRLIPGLGVPGRDSLVGYGSRGRNCQS